MRRIQAIIAAGLTLGLVALATPAQAESITFTDPRGDNDYGGLDIVSAKLKNEQHAFTAKFTVAGDAKGHIIFYMALRDQAGYNVVVHHKAHGRRDFAYLRNDFEQTLPCDGLSHVWHRATVTLTLRVPSSCLNEGTYGDIQARILTEGPYGDDSDRAPDDGYSPWIPRG